MPRATVPLDAIDRHPALAFALTDELPPFVSEWHAHRHHQLLYAAAGSMRLETAGGSWLLPPQRMAWLRGGLEHRVTAAAPLSLRTVYMAPRLTRGPAAECAVLEVTPLAREMLAFAMRWGPDAPAEPLAEAFFHALAALVEEWARAPRDFMLPMGRTPELARAIAYALAHLDGACGIEEAARAASVSARTLARRFESETAMSWRQWVSRARMLRAMEALAAPGASVTRVALDVGFGSQAAFTRAFETFAGESPSAYRRRVG